MGRGGGIVVVRDGDDIMGRVYELGVRGVFELVGVGEGGVEGCVIGFGECGWDEGGY